MRLSAEKPMGIEKRLVYECIQTLGGKLTLFLLSRVSFFLVCINLPLFRNSTYLLPRIGAY